MALGTPKQWICTTCHGQNTASCEGPSRAGLTAIPASAPRKPDRNLMSLNNSAGAAAEARRLRGSGVAGMAGKMGGRGVDWQVRAGDRQSMARAGASHCTPSPDELVELVIVPATKGSSW